MLRWTMIRSPDDVAGEDLSELLFKGGDIDGSSVVGLLYSRELTLLSES